MEVPLLSEAEDALKVSGAVTICNLEDTSKFYEVFSLKVK